MHYADPTNTQLIREIRTNSSATLMILSNGTAWCWGDNSQGIVGIGSELDYHNMVPPWAWPFHQNDYPIKHPVQLTDKTDWGQDGVSGYAGSTFNYFFGMKDANGDLFFWGRNKGAVQPNSENDASSQIAADRSNAQDVLYPTRMFPFFLNTVYKYTSKDCVDGTTSPTVSPCNTFTNYAPATAHSVISPNIIYTNQPTTIANGSSSTPGIGKLYTYYWTTISGPGKAQVRSDPNPTIINLTAGTTTVLKLFVMDTNYNTDSTTMQIVMSTSCGPACVPINYKKPKFTN